MLSDEYYVPKIPLNRHLYLIKLTIIVKKKIQGTPIFFPQSRIF